jgi:hypothetical protein
MYSTCFRAAAALWLAAALLPMNASADDAARFPGAWRLLSAEYRTLDGTPVDSPWGTKPAGIIMYDTAGNMSAQLGRSERPRFAESDQMRGTPEEIRAAFESYSAYWGRYEVDPGAGTVTHLVSQAMFPNWTGSRQVRYYRFEGDRLILSTPPIRRGGREVKGVLVWERMKQDR